MLSSFLIFYSILGVILAQRSHLINYEVLIIEDVYGFAKDGQCLDSYNSILQICLSDRQVKRISKCKSSLLIPKSMKHSVVSLAFPTKFAVMDVTMYMAISFNLGFDLSSSCKHMKSDKANDILCSMCLTDNNYNNKIKYSCDHLLLPQEPASPNLLSLTNLKHCGVTTGLPVRYNGIQARFYEIFLAVGAVFGSGEWSFSISNVCRYYSTLRKIKRCRCPCRYYANTSASFHCILEGDLVFKLNPGPTNVVSSNANMNSLRRIGTIVLSRPDYGLVIDGVYFSLYCVFIATNSTF